MKKYRVTWTVVIDVDVEARDEEDAIDLAIEKGDNGDGNALTLGGYQVEVLEGGCWHCEPKHFSRPDYNETQDRCDDCKDDYPDTHDE